MVGRAWETENQVEVALLPLESTGGYDWLAPNLKSGEQPYIWF